MIPTRAVMELVNKANSALIEAKYNLIEANRIAESEEKVLIEAVQKKVQEGIEEILRNFFPKTAFDDHAWLKRRTLKDVEHDARVAKILEEAINTGAFDDGEGKPTIGKAKHCHFDYSDDGRVKTWKDE